MESSRDRLEAAFEEFVDRVLSGATADLDAFLAQHPELDASEQARLRARARVLVQEKPARRLPFERLGDFRLLRLLGEGGMGVVYLARQESLGRLLALKVLRPELAGSEAAEKRFEREARAIAALRHPGIVAIHAAGEQDGVRWIAMEYVEGRSLDEVLREEGPRLAPARLVRWGRDVARALASAHASGVVHRDVKPSNLRIASDDRALLVDFGLAILEDATRFSTSASFRGTPYYASPEQVDARGKAVDARTDVYSLGATLYECATGRPPFDGATGAQVFHAILAKEPARPRTIAPEVSRDLETVLLHALEKEPDRRYPTAEALARDLDALLEMRPVEARPPGRVTRVVKFMRRNRAASAAVAVAAVLALLFAGVLARQRFLREREFARTVESSNVARAAGDPSAALRAAERALALRPDDAGALALHADVLREAKAKDSRAAVLRARSSLEAYRGRTARVFGLEREVLPLRHAVTTRPMSEEEAKSLSSREDELADVRRDLEALHAEIIEALNLARGLDPSNAEAEDVLADLYLERWRAAVVASDARATEHFRGLVEAHDPSGRHAAELSATVALSLASDPPGAEVFLFRFEEQSRVVPGGEARLVPVPLAGDAPRPPGTWALRVIVRAGEIAPGDLVLSVAGRPIRGTVLVSEAQRDVEPLDRLVSVDGAPVLDTYDAWLADAEDGERVRTFVFERGGADFEVRGRTLSEIARVGTARDVTNRGGVPIEVFRGGKVDPIESPPPLKTRITAAPLFARARGASGTTPLGPLALASGSYLALVRAEGRESVRVPFVIERGKPVELSVTLEPEGAMPEGFVQVSAGPAEVGGDSEAFATLAAETVDVGTFWISDRETTIREYVEFLNAPETIAEIAASAAPIRYPRDPTTMSTGGLWPRKEGGTFAPDPTVLSQPVHGVSWHDAQAYAGWRTARANESGFDFEFRLPTEVEWEKAARGADRRPYPFGSRFVPRWVKGYFARNEYMIEPVLRFPIDESPYGVFDMTGSLWEWCEDECQGGRALRGGAWNFIFPPFFRSASRAGQDPQAADGLFGIRLVIRKPKRGKERK